MPSRKSVFSWIAPALFAVWGCGGGSVSPSLPTGNLVSISPISAVAGSPDLTLDVKGSGFSGTSPDKSIVVWSANGTKKDLATTFVSPTELSAVIPADLIQAPVTAQVLVQTGDALGDVPLRTTDSVAFLVMSPTLGSAVISAISPSTARAGSTDLMLTVTGSNFENQSLQISFLFWFTSSNDPNCCITWLDTTFVSSTELTAVVPAALLQSPVNAQVFVETGDPQGISDGVSYPKSNSVTFTVTP